MSEENYYYYKLFLCGIFFSDHSTSLYITHCNNVNKNDLNDRKLRSHTVLKPMEAISLLVNVHTNYSTGPSLPPVVNLCGLT